MATTQEEMSVLLKANFTGGIPTARDLAPSILFAIVYMATLPLLIYRLSRRADRTLVLLRPSLFVSARIIMLIIRAIQAKQGGFDLNLMIAELILVSVGFLFLIEPVISLWQRHISDAVPTSAQPRWVLQLAWLLKMTLLAAIGTAIAGGAQTGSAFKSADGIQTVRNLREASYCLSLGVVAVAIVAIITTHFEFGLDSRKTLYLLGPAVSLLVVAVYRVAQCFSSDPSAPARSLAAFWILQVCFELLAYLFFLAVSVNKWYPAAVKEEKSEGDVEMTLHK